MTPQLKTCPGIEEAAANGKNPASRVQEFLQNVEFWGIRNPGYHSESRAESWEKDRHGTVQGSAVPSNYGDPCTALHFEYRCLGYCASD